MSNKALYPATNNARSLGTSAMKWSEVHASTVYGKLIHNTVGTWIYSAKNPAVMVSGITSGSAGSAFTIPVKDGYLSV
jgi:VCBS repeat-containing protein